MRGLVFLIAVLFGVLGCSSSEPAYQPETFRKTLNELIAAERYPAAVSFLERADPKRQADYDGKGYLAVAEDLIYLPGIPSNIYYGESDWEMPGTSDVRLDEDWQKAATAFAAEYNQYRYANENVQHE